MFSLDSDRLHYHRLSRFVHKAFRLFPELMQTVCAAKVISFTVMLERTHRPPGIDCHAANRILYFSSKSHRDSTELATPLKILQNARFTNSSSHVRVGLRKR